MPEKMQLDLDAPAAITSLRELAKAENECVRAARSTSMQRKPFPAKAAGTRT